MHSKWEEFSPGGAAGPPAFDTKLAVVQRDDLAAWQKLNATLFMVSGIAATDPETVGPPHLDGSGGQYLPMFRRPGPVFSATRDELRRSFDRALQAEIEMAIFTVDFFTTGHDETNRATMRAVAQDALSLMGIAFRAGRTTANKIVKGLALHP